MQRTPHRIFTAIIGSVVCTLAMHAVWAQDINAVRDPPRWFQEDITPQARLQTLKKEAAAAHRESQSECKKLARADRAACMQAARAEFERDMAGAKQQARATRS